MPTLPHLSPRAITAYNRLSCEVASLIYLTRFAKPSGPLGEAARRHLNNTLRLGNRLYLREAGMPRFVLFDPIDPLSMADVVLLVTRLSAAGLKFEERYAHLTEAGLQRAPARRDADGLPSPHA